jgi:hypothetical protein
MHHPTEKGTQMSNQSHTIGSLLHRFGVAGPARARTFSGTSAPVFALALLLSLAIFALSTAPARADVVHQYLAQITEIPAKGPHGEAVPESGKLTEVNSMTFDSGDLWVVEGLDRLGNGRLDEFNASGDFVSQIIPPGENPSGLAVGDATGETQVYVGAFDSVIVFDPTTKVQIGEWSGAGTPAGTFGLYGGVRDVAVDNSSNLADEARGDVYVADSAQSPCGGGCQEPPQDERAVDVFEPQAGGGEKYLRQLTGACPTEGMTVGEPGCKEGEGLIPFSFPNPTAVVVDQSNGDVFVAGGSGVDVFEPLALHQYRFVRQLPIGGISAVGGGEDNGDIYAGPSQFSPAGVFLGELTGTPDGPFSSVHGVAVDDEPGPLFEHVYVGNWNGNEAEAGGLEKYTGVIDEFGPNVVIPDVATVAATEVVPTSATLNGEVDPLEAEAHEGAECWFVWGTTTAFGKEASCEPRQVAEHEGFVPVHAQLQGLLEPDTTYYYRLQAKNAQDITNPGKESQTQHFTTPGPGIHGESVSDVASTSATLEAAIDPHGAPTSYYFQYGAGASYEYEVPAPPGAAIGSGEADVNVEQHVQENLLPGTVYHYRVVAVSEIEPAKIKDFDGSEATFTTLPPSGGVSALPDDRQWELVSPPDKHGALIEPIADFGLIQSSADGDAFTYVTSSPTESEPRGNANASSILATRGADGWSDQDIATPHNYTADVTIGNGQEYQFFSSDLSRALVEPMEFTKFVGEETSPEATQDTPYVRQDFTCQSTPATCFTPLLTETDVTTGVKYGEEHFGGNGHGGSRPVSDAFVGATPDLSHVVLNVGEVPLTKATPTTPAAVEGGLYEWSAGEPAAEQLQLVSVLPAAEGGGASDGEFGSSSSGDTEIRNAISEDGSRIVWGGEHALYMRDTALEETVRLDLPEAECFKEHTCGSEAAKTQFNMASSDGSMVFFTDTQRLTADSRANGQGSAEPDLYVCQMVEVEEAGHKRLKCDLTDLSVDTNPGEERAAVQGSVVGASEDGSFVYFVADGVLGDGAEHGASTGDCGAGKSSASPSQSCNLYVEHYNDGMWEAPRFIAALSGIDALRDAQLGNLGAHTAGSSPDGRYLAFMSQRDLTGYDTVDVNQGAYEEENEQIIYKEGQPVPAHDEEVYLYHAETSPSGQLQPGKLVCASCNPTGARPDGGRYYGVREGESEIGTENMRYVGGYGVWDGEQWLAANIPGWVDYDPKHGVHQPRYLSNSGRLFFNSHDALVPADVNGQWNVYEYEPPSNGGEGDCTTSTQGASDVYSPQAEGCVGLISSGESSEQSAFLDASASGGDVFFMTTSQLVPQDFDHAYDVYDAHECTSKAPCFPAAAEVPPPCTTEASCKPAPEPQPSIYGLPPSATFSGPGNITPEVAPPLKKVVTKTVKCKKGETKNKKGKCVKKPKKQKNKAKKSAHIDGRAKS